MRTPISRTRWFLIRDHGGIYEGAIVRMFLKPGENPNVVCDQCKDDRRGRPWLGLEIIRGMKRDGLNIPMGPSSIRVTAKSTAP